MTMSAALDSGLAFGLLVVFFGFLYSGVAKNFHWWGTEIYKQVSFLGGRRMSFFDIDQKLQGCDWRACAYLDIPEKGHFGLP